MSRTRLTDLLADPSAGGRPGLAAVPALPPAPEPEPEPKPEPAPAKPAKGTVARRPKGAPARTAAARPAPRSASPARRSRRDPAAALTAAHDSARLDPGAWQYYTLRLPSSQIEAITQRLPGDRASLELDRLAVAHYVEAALAAIPADPAKAAALGLEWRKAHLRSRTTELAGGSATRLSKDTAAKMRDLASLLRKHRVTLQEVASAALAGLRADLEARDKDAEG